MKTGEQERSFITTQSGVTQDGTSSSHSQQHCSDDGILCLKSEETKKATTGVEPVMKVLQTSALPLGHVATNNSPLHIVSLYLKAPKPLSIKNKRETGFGPATLSLGS